MSMLTFFHVGFHTSPQPLPKFFLVNKKRIFGNNCFLCSLLPVTTPMPDDDVVDSMKRSERGALTTKTMTKTISKTMTRTRTKAKTSLLPVIAPLSDNNVVDCMKRSERGTLTTKTIAAGSAAAALLQAGAEDSDHSSIGL